jgi:hypothetical protein
MRNAEIISALQGPYFKFRIAPMLGDMIQQDTPRRSDSSYQLSGMQGIGCGIGA